jgi:Tfp pilus assembly protein PilO
MDWMKIAEAAAIIILGGWNGYKEILSRKAERFEDKFIEEHGLRENPTRCQEHASAINELRMDVKTIKDHLGIV